MANLKTYLGRIKRLLTKKDYWNDKQFPSYWFDLVLGDSPAGIVQIGSNDGKQGDPLHPLILKNKEWRSLFVEPVPYSFEKLKANYGEDNRFTFENVAINEGEKMNFYYVDTRAKEDLPDLPYWFDQLASFDRNHITKHLDGILEPYIITVEVNGINLGDLFSKHKLDNLDILHIDTEGYDWHILQQLDLSRFKPVFILYEKQHLDEKAMIQSKAFLEQDYDLYDQNLDVLAVRKDIESRVRKSMKESMKAF